MKRKRFFVVLILLFLSLTDASANRNGKNLGIDLVGGLPQLFGLELRYIGIEKFTFGASFGSAPLNGVLNSKINLQARAIQNSSPDPLTLLPAATYSLTGLTLFARYFPWIEGWFTQVGFSNWSFKGAVVGHLRNETTGGVANSAVTGSIDITQRIISFTVGRQWFISDFFFEFGFGAGYLIPLKYSISTGGAASTFQDVAPSNNQDDLEQAQNDLRNQADTELQKVRDQLKVIPLLFVSVGWTF